MILSYESETNDKLSIWTFNIWTSLLAFSVGEFFTVRNFVLLHVYVFGLCELFGLFQFFVLFPPSIQHVERGEHDNQADSNTDTTTDDDTYRLTLACIC